VIRRLAHFLLPHLPSLLHAPFLNKRMIKYQHLCEYLDQQLLHHFLAYITKQVRGAISNFILFEAEVASWECSGACWHASLPVFDRNVKY
jgi:hypothetical protein